MRHGNQGQFWLSKIEGGDTAFAKLPHATRESWVAKGGFYDPRVFVNLTDKRNG